MKEISRLSSSRPFIGNDTINEKPNGKDSSTLKKGMEIPTEAPQRIAPTRVINIGFIKLGEDKIPVTGKSYEMVSVSDSYLAQLEIPGSEFKRLNLDLYKLYIDNLPDLTRRNEGFLKIQVNTRNPQDLEGSKNDATVASNFIVKDGNYAPSFLYRGIFRNVIFREWINLRVDLFEMDKNSDEYFNKVKSVINGVPEIKDLDILKGIPYLNLATQLFESVIRVFGKNPDDHIWGEIPILELEPTLGGAFLRNGIYVLFEGSNKKKESIGLDDLIYYNGQIKIADNSNVTNMPNHLIFGIKLRPHKIAPVV